MFSVVVEFTDVSSVNNAGISISTGFRHIRPTVIQRTAEILEIAYLKV